MHKNVHRIASKIDITWEAQTLRTVQCDCLLTAALRTAPPCLYSDRDKPVLWCYQLAICRPATFINTAWLHVMCSSNADTRQHLWFICCTVKHTTVTILCHSTALWQNVWSYTGSATHADGTYGHVRFIRPFLNGLYEAVNIICTKTSCIFLLPFIYNRTIINVTSDFAERTTAIKCHLQLWHTKWGTHAYSKQLQYGTKT
jgi:hypothetical protein